ncbi:MAG: DEAD/DEAH box helicase [Lachnospiraceae bacterium]|nr:DEAD/DEAH box helicase [Lachnospiraceae bacterium]
MASISKEQMNQTKANCRVLQTLDHSLADILTKKQAIESNIRQNYKELQKVQSDKVLEGMDIDNININKDGIRVGNLRNAGIHNVLQVSNMSVTQLQSIEGIGEATASKIESNVKLLRMSTEKNTPVTLDADNPNAQMCAMIQDLYFLIQNDALLKQAQPLYDGNHDAIQKYIADVQIMFASLKWLFASKEKKAVAERTAMALNEMATGEFGTIASTIVESYNRADTALFGSNNVSKIADTRKQIHSNSRATTNHNDVLRQRSAGGVRIIGEAQSASTNIASQAVVATLPQEECFVLFRQNAAPFYAMLEAVMGDALPKATDKSVIALPEELLQSIEAFPLDTGSLKATLRRYQVFGTKYILHQEKVLLGDEMGLGKTMQALAAFCHLAANGARHFLVVCPLSVVVNWKREVESQTGIPAIEVYGEDRAMEMTIWAAKGGVAITSFETLNKVPIPAIVDLQMMVVDEAHYVKNPKAQRTQSVMMAAARAKRVLFMSGTPLENKVEEMQFLIQCLQPQIAEQVKNMNQLIDAEKFRKAIAPVYLRRVREDVLKELPELLEKEQWGLMNSDEMDAYKTALKEGSFMAVRQVSWQLPDMKQSTKAQRLMEICEDAKEGGRKLIIFSFFKDILNKVSSMLGDSCIGVIDGSVPAGERQGMIDKLKDAPAGSALVCQIQAGGVGLNIQAASVVVFCEPQIKPSLETQAVARAYRMGQSQSVMVHRLLMDDTVDERVMEILKQKSQLFDSFADESLIGEMDTQINENAVMKNIIEEEKKRLGLDNSEGCDGATTNVDDTDNDIINSVESGM